MDMISMCGDNCLYCPRHIATQKSNPYELEKVKELWVRLGLRTANFPSNQMICHGCKPENNCAYIELRDCAHTKKLTNCGYCRDYPCKIIKKAFKKSDNFRIRAKMLCTQEEMDMLDKAFFSKKELFDSINHKNRKK